MSDSDASTVDPDDLKETKTTISDSEASTVDPEYLADTEPADQNEVRTLNNSTDLFVDNSSSDAPKVNNRAEKRLKDGMKTVQSYKDNINSEKGVKEKKKAEKRNLLKPVDTKSEKLVKRRSKVHELSDSGSENEQCSNKISAAEIGDKPNEIRKESVQEKLYKKDYSKPFDSKPDYNTSTRDKIDKQKFIRDFLNMSDDEVTSEEKLNSSQKKQKNETNVDKHTKTDVNKNAKLKKDSKVGLHLEETSAVNKSETLNLKTKQRKVETESRKKVSTDSVPVSLKRKSSSPGPPGLKKGDTKILDTDKNLNRSESVKPPCKYGAKCYRKNPSHRLELSHPETTQPSTSTSFDPPPAKKVKVRESPPPRSKSPSPRSKSPIRTPKTIVERVSQAQPYSFFLTRVFGISDKYNTSFVMDIKDILSPEMGTLTSSCQFNYMFDVEWLMKQYPPKFRSKPVLLVHGEQGPSKAELQAQAINYKNVRFCQAKLEMMFGTHHTKMMFLLYENGLRVVIHTSNLIQQDWYQKTQGMWISPVFPKMPSASKDKGDSPTNFKKDLIDYLAAYKAYQLQEWIEHLAGHDMSEARVVIVGSVPGRHTTDKNKWGHLKLRRVLQDHGPSFATVKTWPVIGQFSSIGSMGANKDQWLCGEWLDSLSAAKSVVGVQSKARLQLVFPTKDNVRLSLEGFPAGGSIPYSVNTAKKQPWLHDFFHVWRAEGRGRSRAMPHIKTFLRPSQDAKHVSWFIVTSANLSKAAWGAFEKKGAQLMIRSYEIGVLLLPKFFDKGELFTIAEDIDDAVSADHLLLPYDLPPTPYKKGDRPWMWDIPYMDLPDTNGNMWCPFSR